MSNTAHITFPMVHNNGTGIKTLTAGYDAAADKLQAFIDSWEAVEFNARDYYPQGDGAYGRARDERDSINTKIREVRDYIDAIREHLYA